MSTTQAPRTIAIIGAGSVGTSLGGSLLRAGHSVIYGVRNPSKPEYAALRTSGASVDDVPGAVARAEAIILATPWSAAEAALRAAGNLDGKPLLDATNPLGAGLVLTHGHTDSGGEQVQRWAPTAKVVKIFNTTGAENMADPNYDGRPALMMFCGDDAGACDVAAELARDIGFEPQLVGGLDRARLIEPHARLWIELALVRKLGRGIAFGLMRRA